MTGGRRGLLCGVTIATACPQTSLGTGEIRRRDALLQPHLYHAAPVSLLRDSIPLLLSWA